MKNSVTMEKVAVYRREITYYDTAVQIGLFNKNLNIFPNLFQNSQLIINREQKLWMDVLPEVYISGVMSILRPFQMQHDLY